MKRVLIAAFALAGFSAASFAQSVPATTKIGDAKMQVVKKATTVKPDAKVVAMNKGGKPVTPAITKAGVKPVLVKTPPAIAKPVIAKSRVDITKPTTPVATKAATIAKPAAIAKTSAPLLKKDGTPDKRFKANQTAAGGPLKKDGTPDMRYKANKTHS